jgi:AcrR family transcriptional regulator
VSRNLPARRAAGRRPRTRQPAEADGRAQRSARSREAIVEAMFALVGEGVLEPTAQQVAARADVGLRSVFRHFRDVDSLHAEMGARLRAEVAPLLVADAPAGNLAARGRALVARRVHLYERIAAYKRAANVQRSRSAFLRSRHTALVDELSANLLRWLPELAKAPDEQRDAIELATSFEAWDRLRGDQRLSRERAQAAIERTVLALLDS